jgi:tetratricopeptide (TPR) repeat protein
MQQGPALRLASGSIAATERRLSGCGRWGTAALVLAAWVLLGARAAHAQNAEAEALFTEAENLETAGKIAEACDAFEASNRIEPRAGTLIRLGQCRETQGRLASAWSAYKDALTRVKDPAKKAVAEQRVASLEGRLSFLTVLVSDEARIEGLVIMRNGKALDAALWNRAAPVDGGVYTIGGSAPGHEEWTTTVEVANEKDKASVEVPRFKELAKLVDPPPGGGGGGGDGGGGGGGGRDTDTPSGLTGKRKIAIGAAGVGLAAIAGGVLFGMQAKSLEDEAFEICPNANACDRPDEANEKIDSAGSKAMMSNVMFGVGGVAVIGAAVLWFTGAPKAEPARVGVHPTLRPGYSGVDVTVRF